MIRKLSHICSGLLQEHTSEKGQYYLRDRRLYINSTIIHSEMEKQIYVSRVLHLLILTNMSISKMSGIEIYHMRTNVDKPYMN